MIIKLKVFIFICFINVRLGHEVYTETCLLLSCDSKLYPYQQALMSIMINLIHPHLQSYFFDCVSERLFSLCIHPESHSEVIIFGSVVIGYHAPVRDAIGLVLVSLWRADARERAAQTVHDTRVARECLESV